MTDFVGLDGIEHDYCTAAYNYSATNERAVEIPIFLDWIARQTRDDPYSLGLEVGNVLSHYVDTAWAVVDRYEEYEGVANEDILDHGTDNMYDWIVSISTIEHVGWDDYPQDGWKAMYAVDHMVKLLKPGGKLLLSFPTGHHPNLDIAAGDDHFAAHKAQTLFMARTDNPDPGGGRATATWGPQPYEPIPYLWNCFSAAGVWFGIITKDTDTDKKET